MKHHFTFRQVLVLSTAFLALAIMGSGAAYQAVVLPDPIPIETAGCPSIGKKGAPIEIVLFEDFRCESCRTFNEMVLPEIEVKYVQSGRARFTIVPLAFLRGSKPLANAALAVYKIAPDRFIPYIHELFQEYGGVGNQQLLEIAKKVGGIDLLKLEACLTTHCYYPELEKNFELAKEVMGRDFGTPALYVNGIPTSTASFEAVESRIEKLAEKKRP